MKIHFMRNMLLKLENNSPYSSVVERQSCKLKVRSSILRGGIFFVLTIPASTRSLLKSNRSKENRLMVSSPGWPTCRQRVVKTTSHQQLSIHFFSWPVSVCPLSSLPFPMAAAAAASTSCASPLLLPSGLTTATPSPLLINQVAIIRLVSPQGRGVPPRRGGFTRSGAERGARRRAEPPGNAECLTNS
jgi:hypothetical protein